MFPGRMSYKATKPGLVSFLYLSMRYMVLLFIRAPFYVSLVFVFCLLVVLHKLSLLAKWLARKTPLRKPNHGEGIVSRKPGRRVRVIFLVYCIASLFYYVFLLSPAPTWYNYFPTVMARYNLFVLKVPLNPKQTKQTNKTDIMLIRSTDSYSAYIPYPWQNLAVRHSSMMKKNLQAGSD